MHICETKGQACAQGSVFAIGSQTHVRPLSCQIATLTAHIIPQRDGVLQQSPLCCFSVPLSRTGRFRWGWCDPPADPMQQRRLRRTGFRTAPAPPIPSPSGRFFRTRSPTPPPWPRIHPLSDLTPRLTVSSPIGPQILRLDLQGLDLRKLLQQEIHRRPHSRRHQRPVRILQRHFAGAGVVMLSQDQLEPALS